MRLVSIVLLPLTLSGMLAAAEVSTDAWKAVGPDAGVSAVDGVLTFHYTAGSKPAGIAFVPAALVLQPGAKSLRFEVKTDSPFALAVVAGEKKPGGNYSAIVWSNGDAWQPVTLTTADFSLNAGPNDPPDPDGKLDVDRIESFALLDMSQYLANMANTARIYGEPHTGPHTISIRKFGPSTDDPGPDRPQVAWFSPGGATFEALNGGVTIRYKALADRWTAFLRQIPPHDFTGATHLSLDIQSDHDVQLVVSLKERRGPGTEGARYNIDFTVPAGPKPEHRDLLLSAFNHDENGAPDPDNKLSLDALESITILDVSAEDRTNRIVLQDLRLKTIR